MSTFDQLASSTELSRPVELYSFSLGASSYRYSACGRPITIGVDVYDPEAIDRGGIEQSGERSSETLEVRLPGTNAFVASFINVPPATPATVTILQIEPDETPTPIPIVLFKGFVQPVTFEDDGFQAILSVRSIEAARDRKAPRFSFGAQCQNALYDERCGANPLAHRHIGEVTNVLGPIITVDGLAASGHDFRGGMVTPGAIADPRMVISQSGDDLTMLLPFSESILGQTVECYAGCDHHIDGDCANVFFRVKEFNGFAFVPLRDVWRNGLI